MNVKELVSGTPVPTAGVALGVVSLGNLIEPLGEWLRILCAIVAACLIALVIAKIVRHPDAVRADMQNPVVAGTSGTFFMTIMQLAACAAPFAFAPAFVLWCAAVVGHVALIVWFTRQFIFRFDLKQVFATYFVAYVGIIVAALTSPWFGMEAVGRVLFWFGFVCYAVLLVVVTLRYAKHAVADAAKPTFCIYSAPASLSLTGYLAITPEPNIAFVVGFAVFAQAMFVIVLTQLPKFLRLSFYPSYAAMTFPFVITATAFGRAIETVGAAGYALPTIFDAIGVIEIVFAAAMVVYVVVRYGMMFAAKLATPTAASEPALAAQRVR